MPTTKTTTMTMKTLTAAMYMFLREHRMDLVSPTDTLALPDHLGRINNLLLATVSEEYHGLLVDSDGSTLWLNLRMLAMPHNQVDSKPKIERLMTELIRERLMASP